MLLWDIVSEGFLKFFLLVYVNFFLLCQEDGKIKAFLEKSKSSQPPKVNDFPFRKVFQKPFRKLTENFSCDVGEKEWKANPIKCSSRREL